MDEGNTFKNIVCPEESQIKFFNSYKKMFKHIGCYYMGYILEDTKSSIRASFTTNGDWGAEYINEYVNHCHLWNQVQHFYDISKSKSLILPWSTAPPSTSLQKDIILRREEFYIGSDGISFCKKIGSYKEYYYFAPEIKQKGFLKYVTNNLELLKPEVDLFRSNTLKVINDYKNIKGKI